MLDIYVYGTVDRISPEAPVPVLRKVHTEFRAGGAANVARGIKALGAPVELIGAWSRDPAGSELGEILAVDDIPFHRVEFPTITKTRFVSDNHQLLRVDDEMEPPKQVADDAYEVFASMVDDFDIIVMPDYSKGVFEQFGDGARRVIKACKAHQIVLVDPTGKKFENYSGATLVKPNAKEYRLLARGKEPQKVLSAMGVESILVTDGARGMTLHRRGETPQVFVSEAKEVVDVTGAGDTAMAALAWGLASDYSLEGAVCAANFAAGLAVSKFGCAVITESEYQTENHRGPG